MAKANPAEEVKVLARNKRARHEYHVDETLEAGLVLAGSEVKSIRAGKVTLVDAFADIDKGEAWLHQMDIGVYAFSHGRNHEPRRKRKLLLHRREIDRLVGKIREKSYTMVPLSLYEKKGRVKAELALVHGKQSWDKREDSKKRESQREIDRAMASRRRVALLLLAGCGGVAAARRATPRTSRCRRKRGRSIPAPTDATPRPSTARSARP